MDLLTRMQTFAAVVDAGSFAGAAERLDLAPAMVTRYVAQLEEHLGVRLLNRTTRKLSLTESGSDYCQRVNQIIDLIDDAKNSASQGSIKPSGMLRVTTPSIFGIHHLDRAAVDYVRRYPGVQIDLSISERIVDLVE